VLGGLRVNNLFCQGACEVRLRPKFIVIIDEQSPSNPSLITNCAIHDHYVVVMRVFDTAVAIKL